MTLSEQCALVAKNAGSNGLHDEDYPAGQGRWVYLSTQHWQAISSASASMRLPRQERHGHTGASAGKAHEDQGWEHLTWLGTQRWDSQRVLICKEFALHI